MGEEDLSQLVRCLAIPSDRNFELWVIIGILICYVRQGESALGSSTVLDAACTHGMFLQQKGQAFTLKCETDTE